MLIFYLKCYEDLLSSISKEGKFTLFSIQDAIESISCSQKLGAISCKLRGSPSFDKRMGMETAGQPKPHKVHKYQ